MLPNFYKIFGYSYNFTIPKRICTLLNPNFTTQKFWRCLLLEVTHLGSEWWKMVFPRYRKLQRSISGLLFSLNDLVLSWLLNDFAILQCHSFTIISSPSNFLRFAIIEHMMDTIFLLVNLAYRVISPIIFMIIHRPICLGDDYRLIRE